MHKRGRSTHTKSKLRGSREVNQHGKTEKATQNPSELGKRTRGSACKGNRTRAPDRASVLTRISLYVTVRCIAHLSIIYPIFDFIVMSLLSSSFIFYLYLIHWLGPLFRGSYDGSLFYSLYMSLQHQSLVVFLFIICLSTELFRLVLILFFTLNTAKQIHAQNNTSMYQHTYTYTQTHVQ